MRMRMRMNVKENEGGWERGENGRDREGYIPLTTEV